MNRPPFDTEYVCPACRDPLRSCGTSLECQQCRLAYPVEDGVVDFAGGEYYDNFDPAVGLPPDHAAALKDETEGTRRRINDFYSGLLAARFGLERERASTRILDCGCGNGLGVDVLADFGFEAWGIDLSSLRKWQWRERRQRKRLAVAMAQRLPFRDGFFDAIISSGVFEHIGVVESRTPRYRVERTEDQEVQRLRFIQEVLRVVRPGGRIWLDFPNGAFPIDFWHTTNLAGGARFHLPSERFLPSVREIKGLLALQGTRTATRVISPYGRLQFRRIGRRRFGGLLGRMANWFFRMAQKPGFEFLARSPVNPYLVIEVTRES
jgi:SAM-dependent methyltransferase